MDLFKYMLVRSVGYPGIRTHYIPSFLQEFPRNHIFLSFCCCCCCHFQFSVIGIEDPLSCRCGCNCAGTARCASGLLSKMVTYYWYMCT